MYCRTIKKDIDKLFAWEKQMTSWPGGQIPSFLYHWLTPGKRRRQTLELITITTLCVLLQFIRYIQIFF